MNLKKCLSCGKKFRICPQVSSQKFCSNSKCQRERKRIWQKEKRKNDPDYKDNQSRAQELWNKKNPDYWSKYRRTHPEYTKRNQDLQKKRNNKKVSLNDDMSVLVQNSSIPSGLYRLSKFSKNEIAKMDLWIVEIKFISSTSFDSTIAK